MKKQYILPMIGSIFLLLFSFYLMFRTFGYDQKANVIKIAPKLWSDFGAHIPMIRSFSMGPNLNRLITLQPIESPLFPGEPIRYHFGFYAIAGMLEKLGLRIDWALNVPSVLGMFLLLLGIYWFSWELFKSKWISVLSLFFFLFNGTLAFIPFFQKYPLSPTTFTDIITNSRFVVFGPWDGQDITAFWNMNIYTNQRHLAFSYAVVLLILSYLLRLKKTKVKLSFKNGMIIGIMAAFLFFINYAAASIAGLFLIWFFLAKKESRLPLLFSTLIALPALLILQHLSNVTSHITFDPGYLAHHPLSPQVLVEFWFANLGLHMFLIPLGLLFAPKKVKKLLIIPLLVLFLAPNVYRFSADMINNHKFFNFFIIIGGMFSAFALVRMWEFFKKKFVLIRLIGQIGLICAGFLLIFSGILDVFPVINDAQGGLVDYTGNPDAQFIKNNTPVTAVFADSLWFYHPANLVGRSIYSGYTYFTWSYGYDMGKREEQLLSIYRAQTQTQACDLLNSFHVTHVELSANPEAYVKPNLALWDNMTPLYKNPDTNFRIFSRDDICAK